jgi:hypothetical protein
MIHRFVGLCSVLVLAALASTGATCNRQSSAPGTAVVTAWPTGFPTPYPPIPTPYPTALPADFPTAISIVSVAHNESEAAAIVREVVTSPPPLIAQVSSIAYTRTTVGQARGLLDPTGETKSWNAPDNIDAWVFVAHGSFSIWTQGVATHVSPAYTTLWIVVPVGQKGTFWATNNNSYDLSQLAPVGRLSLPLPPWPTPVEFSTPAPTTSLQ